jgi:hypothetical protein
MLKIRDVVITPETYGILNTKVRELGTSRGRFFSGFSEEWELILRVISSGINNSLYLFSYEVLQDLLKGKKEIKAILLERSIEMFHKSYSLLTRGTYKHGIKDQGATIQKATEAFNEFYDNHLFGYLESIARRPKKFSASGTAEDSLICNKDGVLYDCCRDYKERAWVALAILKKDPFLKVEGTKDHVLCTLVEFDGRGSKKTDSAVLTSKMEKIARVFRADDNLVYSMYGKYFLTGAVARYFSGITEPPRHRRRGQRGPFTSKVDIQRRYSGKDLAVRENDTFAWEEEEAQNLLNFIRAIHRRADAVKAALPPGGVEEMYTKVFDYFFTNMMSFMNHDDKAIEKQLSTLFLEGFPVDKALKILNKTLNQK